MKLYASKSNKLVGLPIKATDINDIPYLNNLVEINKITEEEKNLIIGD